MNSAQEFGLKIIPSGVPNLDPVLGGGIPAGSLNLIAGGPGTGKTILSQQMMFSRASKEREVLHFTVLGEPVAKLLRYQSRFSFFDPSKVNTSIRFIDLGDIIRKQGLERGVEVIISSVEHDAPSMVIVDSTRALREMSRREGDHGSRGFIHDLAQVAAVWDCTSFLVGQYNESELRAGPESTLADSILWLAMEQVGDSVLRKLRVIKSRGLSAAQGPHGFKIDENGIRVFPRLAPPELERRPPERQRVALGVPGLDGMLSDGIPRGEACLIAGALGTGKSVLAQQFIAAGVAAGESSVAMTFEESPGQYAARAQSFGWEFPKWVEEGRLSMVYRGSMDLSVDELVDAARETVDKIGARRFVLDSLSGFELACSPVDRPGFRESLQRLVRWLTSGGVTVMVTMEIPEVFGEPRFPTREISFVADNVILLRHVEVQSEMRRVLAVMKMRSSSHSREVREYTITRHGIDLGRPFPNHGAALPGTHIQNLILCPHGWLSPEEHRVMEALLQHGDSTSHQVAEATGLDEKLVARILRELSRRRLVAEITRAGHITYRAVLPDLHPEAPRHGTS